MKIRYILNILIILGFIFIGSKTYADENNSYDKQLDGIGSGVTNNIDDYKLYQNYPNPFNPVTKISYKLNAEGFVSLKVYNLVGQVVATLVNETKEAGVYSVTFDGSQLTTGIYLYKLQVNGFTSVKRMTLIK